MAKYYMLLDSARMILHEAEKSNLDNQVMQKLGPKLNQIKSDLQKFNIDFPEEYQSGEAKTMSNSINNLLVQLNKYHT
jgi:hypothetical protein